MRASWSILGLALGAFAVLTGCGAEARDATSKELSALTAEISKLRAEQAALGERLQTLERGKPEAPASAAKAADAGPPAVAVRPVADDRPALDVVRLGPSQADDDTAGDGDIDADGPRTVLRSTAKGTIVEEQSGPGGTATTADGGAAKPAPAKAARAKDGGKKSDKSDRPKTAALPTP